ENMLPALFHRSSPPVRALVVRISKVQCAIRSYPDIVRSIQQLSLKFFNHDFHFAIGADLPEFVLLIRASPEVSGAIKAETIGPAARFKESRELSFDTPLVNSVVRLIGKKDVAISVRCRSFRKRKTIRQLLHLRV